MVIGYVFSRKDNKEFTITKGNGILKEKQIADSTKLYTLFKRYIFYKNLSF